MSAALTEKLKEKMSAVTGKQVVLETSVDPQIIGGIVVKLGNEQFDTSLRTPMCIRDRVHVFQRKGG